MADALSVLATYQQGVNEKLDYSIDWSDQLALDAADTISSSTWAGVSGSPTIGNGSNGAPAPSHSNGLAVAWVISGSINDEYVIKNQVTTTAGRVLERRIRVLILGDTTSATISNVKVGGERTWYVAGYRATNLVTVLNGFVGTFALEPDLNPGTFISTVSSVTLAGPASVTASSLAVTHTKRAVVFTLPALSTAGKYTVKVTVTTNDSQTITSLATLKVE